MCYLRGVADQMSSDESKQGGLIQWTERIDKYI